MQHTIILILQCNLQHSASCSTPEYGCSIMQGLWFDAECAPRIHSRIVSGFISAQAAGYRLLATGYQLLQHTRILIFYRNLQLLASCRTPEHGLSTAIYRTRRVAAHQNIDFSLQFTALGRLQHTRILIFHCNLQHSAGCSTPEY